MKLLCQCNGCFIFVLHICAYRYRCSDDGDHFPVEHLLHRHPSMGCVLPGHGIHLRTALVPLQQLVEHLQVSHLHNVRVPIESGQPGKWKVME